MHNVNTRSMLHAGQFHTCFCVVYVASQTMKCVIRYLVSCVAN
jgi:hypothetical protein